MVHVVSPLSSKASQTEGMTRGLLQFKLTQTLNQQRGRMHYNSSPHSNMQNEMEYWPFPFSALRDKVLSRVAQGHNWNLVGRIIGWGQGGIC